MPNYMINYNISVAVRISPQNLVLFEYVGMQCNNLANDNIVI